MKRFFTSWKFIFIAAVLLICFMFFLEMMRFELKPPSEGWSRAVRISEVVGSDTRELRQIRVDTVPLVSENQFVTIWRQGNFINYAVFDASGKMLINKKVDFNIKDSFKIKAKAEKDIITIYNLNDKKLDEYKFNYRTGEALSSRTIDDEVIDFTVADNVAAYLQNDRMKIIDTNSFLNIDIPRVKMVESVKKKNGSYYFITYGYELNNNVNLECIVYDAAAGSIKRSKIANFPVSNNVSVQNIDIGVEKDKINALVVLKDSRTNESSTIEYTFPITDMSKVSSKNIELEGFEPNPAILKENQDSFMIIASVEAQKGRKSSQINAALLIYSDNKLIDKRLLTKTDEVSVNPHFFKLGSDSYVQWEDISGRSKAIKFASTNKDIVKMAENLNKNEWINLILDVIVYQASGLSFILLIFVSIILPSLVVILIISMFNLNWVEANAPKVLSIAMVVQYFSKLWLANRCVIQNRSLQGILPHYLQNPLSLFFIVTMVAVVPVYCVKNKYLRTENEKSFLEQYAFFAILDIVLYVLIYFPYYSI